MLELYYNFFKKFCDVDMFEELEMDTDSLYLALAEINWKIVSDLKWERNGRGFDQVTVSINSLLMLRETSSREHVV